MAKMPTVYGVISPYFYDVSKSLQGAKCYATRRGFDKIGKRVGYNVTASWTKIKGKWEVTPC